MLRVIFENYATIPPLQDKESRDMAATAFQDGTAPLALTTIRTEAKDLATGRSTCGAILTIGLPQGTRDTLAGNLILSAAIGEAGWKLEADGRSAVVDVRYQSQLTDDRAKVYVELAGAQQIAPTAGLLAVAASIAASAPQPAAQGPRVP